MAIRNFTIRRRIEIDAAHRVPDHNSKCFNLHGHRYVIECEVEGQLFTEGEQTGMVMDFGFIKEVMMDRIHEPCDHGMILSTDDYDMLQMVAHVDIKEGTVKPHKGVKLYVLDSVPTAENLARHWYEEVMRAINERAVEGRWDYMPEVKAMRVWETPNCLAVYPS